MRRPIVIAAALVPAVVALVLWQAGARRPSAAAASAAAPALPTPADRPPPPAPPRAPSLAADLPGPGTETIAMLDDARARFAAAARPCWTDRPPVETPPNEPDDTIGELRFRYSLLTDGTEAHVDGLTIIHDTFRDRGLRDCIERAITAARWQSTAAPGRTAVNDQLRVGDLTRRVPREPR